MLGRPYPWVPAYPAPVYAYRVLCICARASSVARRGARGPAPIPTARAAPVDRRDITSRRVESRRWPRARARARPGPAGYVPWGTAYRYGTGYGSRVTGRNNWLTILTTGQSHRQHFRGCACGGGFLFFYHIPCSIRPLWRTSTDKVNRNRYTKYCLVLLCESALHKECTGYEFSIIVVLPSCWWCRSSSAMTVTRRSLILLVIVLCTFLNRGKSVSYMKPLACNISSTTNESVV